MTHNTLKVNNLTYFGGENRNRGKKMIFTRRERPRNIHENFTSE